MKTITSIVCVLVCTISIPLGIFQIIEGNRVLLFSILLALQMPGYISSCGYLLKKYPN